MKLIRLYTLLTYFIAAVWFINGFFCKVLGLVPRHEQIVSEILGDEYSSILTIVFGMAEVVMAIWVLSRFKPRINALLQMIIVGSMNIIEFFVAPELLLWGRLNAVFALLFIGLVYYHEFVLRKSTLFK